MDYLNRFRLIPFFDAPDGGGGGDPKSPDNPPADPPKLSFDDFLKDKDNQTEFNNRLQAGIKTALDNERARLEAIADERVSEAEKLAKMTEAERRAYEQKKADEKMQQRERDITRRELMADAKGVLGEKKLPAALADILDYADKEKCDASIEMVEKVFNEAVETAVNEKLKGRKPPKDVPPGSDMSELEEQIMKYMKG